MKSIKPRIAVFLILSLSLLLPALAPAEFRIATVDVNRIINEAPESKTVRKTLDEKTTKAKEKIEVKRTALKSTEDKIKAGKIKEDSKEADKFRSELRDFNRLVKDSEEELKRDFMKYNKTLTDKALELVRQYAEKKGYDLVLDRSQEVRGPVLFGKPEADITEEVLKEMK